MDETLYAQVEGLDELAESLEKFAKNILIVWEMHW